MNDALSNGTRNNHTPFPTYLFGFSGRIGPAQYFIGLVIAIAVLLAAFVLAAGAMAPTGGGGGAMLAIPLFVLFLWILVAAMVQRLRDAGRRPALAILYILGPLLVLFPGLEFIEYAGILLALMFLAFIAAPGFLKPKTSDEAAASP
jgi:uncharacterized membrane protein YhaH (DUF805 family)